MASEEQETKPLKSQLQVQLEKFVTDDGETSRMLTTYVRKRFQKEPTIWVPQLFNSESLVLEHELRWLVAATLPVLHIDAFMQQVFASSCRHWQLKDFVPRLELQLEPSPPMLLFFQYCRGEHHVHSGIVRVNPLLAWMASHHAELAETLNKWAVDVESPPPVSLWVDMVNGDKSFVKAVCCSIVRNFALYGGDKHPDWESLMKGSWLTVLPALASCYKAVVPEEVGAKLPTGPIVAFWCTANQGVPQQFTKYVISVHHAIS
eukprot:m.196357 g.196357  ORF g.196357 m.196357 type:complete len:262 (+) comp17012_c0_seq4:283-1068(+)